MYLFGKNVLYEYLKTNTIKQVYLTKKDLKIVKVLEQNQIKYQFVGDDFLQQNQINCHHQGIIIELKQKTVTSDLKTYLRTELKQKAIFLIVDSLQDSQNFGAILRSALAFNVINIVYKKDQQVQINDLVIKASMGAINHLNL
jgi:23S rRNA (guanosine2251-2'-O)-methyltransferase